MESYQEFLLESTMILVVFYLGYIAFFSHETSFRQNRAYLLAGILFSIIFPFIQFPLPSDYQINALIRLREIEVIASGKQVLVNRSIFSFNNIILIIYLTGVLFVVIKDLHHFRIISRFRRNSKIVKNNYGNLVFTGKRHPAFSFMKSVYIDSETENSNDLEVILKHEKVHVVQMHSIDLFLLEFLVIVQWFNPLVWLYRKIIRQNHEYLADQGVINDGLPADAYQYLLLNNFSVFRIGFANSFNHSLTFKRLIMMKKVNSNKLSVIKLILIVPIIMMGIYFVSCSNKEEMKDDMQNSDLKVIKGQENSSEGVLLPPPPPPPPVPGVIFDNKEVDVSPQYPGGEAELINFIAKNTNYPKVAKEKGIQGKVYIQFVVSKSGRVENSIVIKSANPLLDEEALRVVNSMPVWKPGLSKGEAVDVYYTIPIIFKLQ